MPPLSTPFVGGNAFGSMSLGVTGFGTFGGGGGPYPPSAAAPPGQ